MARRVLFVCLLAALLAAGPAKASPTEAATAVCGASCYAAPAGSGALFLFSGHGFGHGVGMSQYGAYGYAQNGWTYDQILAHYYPGTTLGPAPLDTIRVLLAGGKKTLTISSPLPFTVADGDGVTHTLAAGKQTLGTGFELPVDGQPPQALPPPLTFSPGDAGVLRLGRSYHGQIVVDLVDGKLRAVNVVGIEQYLDGVVPAEMPSSWSSAALEAQAVASRSYALATRTVAAPFDVYGDSRSQLYRGVGAETPSTNAAVEATAGQVLLYDGQVATTLYFSTSGGQTESAADVWGGQTLPYLVSVTDPYDVISPYHDWGPVPVTARKIARSLKVAGKVVDATTTANPAGRVATLDVVSVPKGTSGTSLTTPVGGPIASGRLGLRSTWFDVGVLSLAAPSLSAPVPYGTPVTLTGFVRSVDDVVVEQRNVHLRWSDLASVTPDENGSVSLVETPTITTDYRLATSQAAAAYVRIRVTPSVSLDSPQGGTEMSGSELPVLPGAPVLVQQQNPDGSPAWTTVASGTVDASGAFSVPVALVPGTYRAVVAPGHGYWPGASAAVTVAG